MKTTSRRVTFEDHNKPHGAFHIDKRFLKRMFGFLLVGFGIVIVSVLIGMWGYMALEGMVWIDALTNSCMLLGGMGPLKAPATFGGKLFASFYSLYCGLFVLLVLAILMGPLFHKVIDHFHLHDAMPESDKE